MSEANERKTCGKCSGTGQTEHWRKDGTMQPCSYCRGVGSWVSLTAQYGEILKLLSGRKPGLRKSRPKWAPDGADFDVTTKHARAYYIWRLARFHGGVDMTMPVTASWGSAGDPDMELLDAMAEDMAKRYLGTDMAGALRWARAMGY